MPGGNSYQCYRHLRHIHHSFPIPQAAWYAVGQTRHQRFQSKISVQHHYLNCTVRHFLAKESIDKFRLKNLYREGKRLIGLECWNVGVLWVSHYFTTPTPQSSPQESINKNVQNLWETYHGTTQTDWRCAFRCLPD